MATPRPPGGQGTATPRARIGVDLSELRAAPAAARRYAQETAREIETAFGRPQREQAAADRQRIAELRAALTQRRVAVRAAAREELETQRQAQREQQALERQRLAELRAALTQRRVAVRAALRAELEERRRAAAEQRALAQQQAAAERQILAQQQARRGQIAAFAGAALGGPVGALAGAALGGAAVPAAIGLAVAQAGRFAVEADTLATAYRRQEVAARNLAGSQAQLNRLMAAYAEATGGAINRAQSLADVTRLQAVGFADSAEELTRFTVASRGAAIAMGQSQDYILSQVQLAIANQSLMRLDQIGLGVEEVTERIDELRAANADLSKEAAFQEAILGLLEQKYGALADAAEAQATGMERLRRSWADFRLEAGLTAGSVLDPVGSALAGGVDAASGAVRRMREGQPALPSWITGTATDAEMAAWRAQLREQRQELQALGQSLAELEQITGVDLSHSIERTRQQMDDLSASIDTLEMKISMGQVGAPLPAFGPQIRPPGAPSTRTTPGAARWTEEQTALIRDWAEGVQAIERNAHRARLDATESYEQQRTQTIRRYEQTIAREAEDFARQRARAEQQFADQIADIRADAARREARQAQELARDIARARQDSAERVAEWEADHAERIAELRTEGNRRLQELEEEYQRDRQRALEQHRESLLDAAARLDAAAVLAEQRRFARQQRDAEEQHRERVEDERENLERRIAQEREAHEERLRQEQESLGKRIRQEQEAHEERLREARAADAERIADMQADFEERKRIEDEDRAIRLARMAEDHQDQLDEMDRQHGLRIRQIEDQAKEERDKLDAEFRLQMVLLGAQIDAWIAEQQRLTDEAIEQFDRWFTHVQLRAAGLRGLSAIEGGSHPSEADPYIDLPPPIPRTHTSPMASASSTITIESGAITVYGAPGQSPQDIGMAVRDELARLFQEIA